ncbi:MAG: MBL fold metallo-hydrolase [Verrucomicrobiota bacterium]
MPFPQLTFLGNSGILLRMPDCDTCIDPYLTDAVAEVHGDRFRRRIPPPVGPAALAGLNAIFLTHAHEDHTDLCTLLPMLSASREAVVVAPRESRELLASAGVPRTRLAQPGPGWLGIGGGLQFRALPAAHLDVETHANGEWRHVGYLFRWPGGMLYHAGDTIPHPAIITELEREGQPDWALLPVNERSYFRSQRGIIGNMSPREAFEFADVIGARHVIPMHWDIFPDNGTSIDEILAAHRQAPRRFTLKLLTAGESTPLVSSPIE